MSTMKLEQLGVVEIYPRPRVRNHRLHSSQARASGDNFVISQEQESRTWKPIEPYDFKCTSLAEVISKKIEPVGTALIIVHMTINQDGEENKKTIERQVAAIAAAQGGIGFGVVLIHKCQTDI